MMPALTLCLLAACLAVLLWLALRPSPASSADASLHPQLVELRAQLAAIVQAQQRVPEALAAGREQQQRALTEDLSTLAQLVARQLAQAQHATGQRLDETSRAMADVRERLGQVTELAQRMEGVGRSVAEVQSLLAVPKLRGTLGEVWLEELLRQVFPESQWTMQYAFRGGERVDAVLRIGDRLVPIDAKFPLEACQRMLALEACPDPERTRGGVDVERERRLFRRSLRDRVDEIASKYIRPDEGTFDFALMYIPAEQVYYEAIVRDAPLGSEASVVAYAMSRRVIPVSPHTFYAYLSAVLHGLKGLQVEERARELQGELASLGRDFARFRVAFEKVGTHLGNATRQYAESERAAERVWSRVERLGSGDAQDDSLPPSVEPVVRLS
jgi:DNA recombination protein RmuC